MAESTSARAALDACRARGLMLAVAESCTGGMIAAALTDVAGASAVFDRGFVTYSDAAKTAMLGVAPTTLAAHGAVSEPVAAEMAQGARDRAGVAAALSVTGIAGPGGSDRKPEGRVCFGWALPGGGLETETVDFGPRGRAAVRAAARDYALSGLVARLDPLPGP
jgi:nicotinamide-nucleotide amidase